MLQGLRALVVDALPESRDAVAGMLQGLGLRVDSVASGPLAIAAFACAAGEGDPHDVVLLDWAMPGLDGIATGAQLHHARVPPQAMVLLAARGPTSMSQLARDAGFDAVLPKPVTPSMLLDCLVPLLRSSARHRATARPKAGFDLRLPIGHRGARVLLAEDNRVDQEVGVQLLASVGLTVDVVDDGLQAVAMVRSRRYDLVLMDMQMPRMDGLEATRLLRLDPSFAQLPIIAMTANAFLRDRQACLDAGMNDHLAKPVGPAVLLKTLLRWLPAERQLPPRAGAVIAAETPARMALAPAAAAQPACAAAPGPEQILAPLAALVDLPQAYEYAAGQATILLRVMLRFVAHYRDTGRVLVEQVRAGDKVGPVRTLHALRGVSGMIGADGIKALTVQIEQGIAEGQPQHRLLPQALQLQHELDALIAGIARHVE